MIRLNAVARQLGKTKQQVIYRYEALQDDLKLTDDKGRRCVDEEGLEAIRRSFEGIEVSEIKDKPKEKKSPDSDIIDLLKQQIADRDRQIEELKADKDRQIEELKADKEELKADKERLNRQIEMHLLSINNLANRIALTDSQSKKESLFGRIFGSKKATDTDTQQDTQQTI